MLMVQYSTLLICPRTLSNDQGIGLFGVAGRELPNALIKSVKIVSETLIPHPNNTGLAIPVLYEAIVLGAKCLNTEIP